VNILKLAAQLILDGTRFKGGLKEAEVAATRFSTNVSKDIKGRLAGAFSVGALGFGAKRLIDLNSTIKDTAAALDISTDAFQEQSYWLTQNGAEASALTAAYRGLARARAAAIGGDDKKMSLFELMGIDAEALQSGSIEEIAKKTFEAFRTTDFGADKMAVAMDLFGKGGTQILPALESSLAYAASEAQRLGQVINKDVNAGLEEMGDRLDRVVGMFKNLGSGVLLGVLRGLDFAGTTIAQGALGLGQQGARAAHGALGMLGSIPGVGGFPSLQKWLREADASMGEKGREMFTEMLDRYDPAKRAERDKKKLRGSAYLDDSEPEEKPEKVRAEREIREPRDQGDPGRANEVSALTRVGQLSARDATMTAREPVEKLIELARTQLAVEKEQAASLKILEQRKPTRINAHY
jgi:hypothetical protein